MKRDQAAGTKTLLLSVAMSAPGPLVMGLGLLAGRSSTQIADFVRRSAELLGILVAYIVYRITAADTCDAERKQRLERRSNIFVGLMMCLGGGLMLLLTLTVSEGEKGNVIPALVIALLGAVANTLFWRKYSRLNRARPNAILAVQARLYRAKSLVDACVSAALLAVTLFPASPVSFWLDRLGSGVVALYLLWCGIKTVAERLSTAADGPAKAG